MKFSEIYSDYATCVYSELSTASNINAKTINGLIQKGLKINHKFKNHILNKGFKNTTEEINFYKNVKPKLLGVVNALHFI